MKRLTLIIAACVLSLGMTTANAQDQEARSMADLLKLIESGTSRDSREARQREQAFKQAQGQQQSLLNQARAERTRQENILTSKPSCTSQFWMDWAFFLRRLHVRKCQTGI